jgi:hypothetical protein
MTNAPVFKHHRLPAKAPTTLVAGRWYNGFDCHDCEKIIAIFETDGVSPIPSPDIILLSIICPHCDEERLYRLTTMKRFQHA